MEITSTCRTATRPFWETARSATSKKAESRLQLGWGFPEASRRDFDFSNSTIICTSRVPVSSITGLAEAEVRTRLKAEGFNELPRLAHRTPLWIVLDVLREPMLALLLAGGGIYLLLSDLAEALILLFFAGLSMAITVVQETRTERVLEALRDLTSPRALVNRDGRRLRIAGRDVVRGDVIVLGEGDRACWKATIFRWTSRC